MPIREYKCPKHGIFAQLLFGEPLKAMQCPKILAEGGDIEGDGYIFPTILCGEESSLIEFSVPARRDPRHGDQSG